MLNPKTLFTQLLHAIDNQRAQDKERNRRSSRNWRAKQLPETLKAQQRQWERDYRSRLKGNDPAKYTAYCKGNINA